MTEIRKGVRVSTPLGSGVVESTRNGPPDFSKPVAVSVILDEMRGRPRYTGTIFHVNLVELCDEYCTACDTFHGDTCPKLVGPV